MNRSSALKNFIKKYKHAWVFLYAFIYMPWFMYLEKHITAESEYHVIHSVLDDKIPLLITGCFFSCSLCAIAIHAARELNT